MASLKKLGFFWGDDKITLVEFDKNTPVQTAFAPLTSKSSIPSPFSSSLTEEIQITTLLKKILDECHISSGSFCVSLPMKEIILRSFVIPFIKEESLQSAIKFEAKKYIPFDMQELNYSFHTIPFMEGQTKKLQVILFAVRKDIMARYERIFKQVNIDVSLSEPAIVSLTKALLFRKDIKSTEHLAFLSLEKNLGRICFINQGMPQFIREFPISIPLMQEENRESAQDMNLKIVNETGNSFDFYSRQFSGEKIDRLLLSSELLQQGLISALEAELKLSVSQFSPVIQTGAIGRSDDINAIYAMGACVPPPSASLSKFNFVVEKEPKAHLENKLMAVLKPYKEIVVSFSIMIVFLIGVFAFFQVQLGLIQEQLHRLSLQEGASSYQTQDSIEALTAQSKQQLRDYKNIRVKSSVSSVIFVLASHFPQGTLLNSLSIAYDQGDSAKAHVTIDMKGDVVLEGTTQQIAMVHQIFTDLKNDKFFHRFVSKVDLVSFYPENRNDRQVTAFNIHCS